VEFEVSKSECMRQIRLVKKIYKFLENCVLLIIMLINKNPILIGDDVISPKSKRKVKF